MFVLDTQKMHYLQQTAQEKNNFLLYHTTSSSSKNERLISCVNNEPFIFWEKRVSYGIGKFSTQICRRLRLLRELNSLRKWRGASRDHGIEYPRGVAIVELLYINFQSNTDTSLEHYYLVHSADKTCFMMPSVKVTIQILQLQEETILQYHMASSHFSKRRCFILTRIMNPSFF